MTWQVVALLHDGAVRVVSEHRSSAVASTVAFVMDGWTVATRGNAGYHYDVREKPEPAPMQSVGLSGWCEHGEQMLNACALCETDALRREVRALSERTTFLEQGIQALQDKQRRWWGR